MVTGAFRNRVNQSPLVQDGVLIHLVATETGHYVYDTYSNCFFSADAISYEILTALQRDTAEARVDALLDLRHRFADDALLAALARLDGTRAHDVLKPLPADLELQLEESSLLASGRGRFRTLVLEVTEACNLRCSYCVYSGDYEHERVHTTRHMSEETAFQAIDLFLAHAEPTERPVINFYGGEALLRKSLVQACMAYAREKDPTVELSITTNAFLLDADWIPVLVKYHISLFVSVDGPKRIHDRFRVLGSQRGTFDRVSCATAKRPSGCPPLAPCTRASISTRSRAFATTSCPQPWAARAAGRCACAMFAMCTSMTARTAPG